MKNYLNSAVAFTQLNQLFRGLSGILTLILIPLFLTKEQQGYWFTMTSLAALAMLAELGFFQVVLQFAAHEFAYLRFDHNDIVGSEEHEKRLASLFCFLCQMGVVRCRGGLPGHPPRGVPLPVPTKDRHPLGHSLDRLRGGRRRHLLHERSPLLSGGLQPGRAIQRLRLSITALTMVFMWLGLVFRFGLHALSLSMLAGRSTASTRSGAATGALFVTFLSESGAAAYSWRRQIPRPSLALCLELVLGLFYLSGLTRRWHSSSGALWRRGG